MTPQEAYHATRVFPTLGTRRALNLWKNGIKSSSELAFMSDKDLLELNGIDDQALAEIRQFFPTVTWTKALDRRYKNMLEEVSMAD